MTIRKKMVLISVSTAIMVAGVGATGLRSLIDVREYLRILPPTPATIDVDNAINLMIILTPLSMALAAGVGLSIAGVDLAAAQSASRATQGRSVRAHADER